MRTGICQFPGGARVVVLDFDELFKNAVERAAGQTTAIKARGTDHIDTESNGGSGRRDMVQRGLNIVISAGIDYIGHIHCSVNTKRAPDEEPPGPSPGAGT